MISFRKELYADPRYNLKSDIQELLDVNKSYKNLISKSDLESLKSQATTSASEADKNKDSTFLRLKKVIAVALHRDAIYGQRGYAYLRGLGFNGLFIENYVSSDKLTKYAGKLKI